MVRLGSSAGNGKVLESQTNSDTHLEQSFVYTLYDLCEHPEYIDRLRKGLAQTEGEWWNSLDSLPFLDSFLRESARLNPSDSSRYLLNPSSTKSRG